MKKRIFSLFLCLTLCLSLLPAAALAETDAGWDESLGICPHHPEHTEECGYAAATQGKPCTHQHSLECYPEGPNQEDSFANQDTQALVCIHIHDESCGYVEDDPGHPCEYECPICPLQKQVDELPDEVTEENAETVSAQLDRIAEIKAALTSEQQEQVDFTRYKSVAAELLALADEAEAALPVELANTAAEPAETGEVYQISSADDLEAFCKPSASG